MMMMMMMMMCGCGLAAHPHGRSECSIFGVFPAAAVRLLATCPPSLQKPFPAQGHAGGWGESRKMPGQHLELVKLASPHTLSRDFAARRKPSPRTALLDSLLLSLLDFRLFNLRCLRSFSAFCWHYGLPFCACFGYCKERRPPGARRRRIRSHSPRNNPEQNKMKPRAATCSSFIIDFWIFGFNGETHTEICAAANLVVVEESFRGMQNLVFFCSGTTQQTSRETIWSGWSIGFRLNLKKKNRIYSNLFRSAAG
uniref:Putative secreted protein n=1 Tax=Anopheles marajoara TaxID=58244 RepID=A0A2M4C5M0_9DIPT